MRFNETKVKAMPTETSYEGGAVYAKNSLEEWINMLFSDFVESNFYETHISRQKRFEELTNAVIKDFGAEFAAKAAIFALVSALEKASTTSLQYVAILSS